MIAITDKSNCCGCSACSQACPVQCISMKADEEGFLYPYVDEDHCIQCNKCIKICPEISAKKNAIEQNRILKGVVVQNKDKSILKESTSGGFFSALANFVIEHGGIVFGAMYDKDLNIIHGLVRSIDELYKLRNSKYSQSNISNSFRECKSLLDDNILVCFSGTPCQIAGLKTFLNKEYKNLITVDVICRGVSSPLLLKKYIDWNGGKNEIKNIKFRDKYYGYYSSTMSVYRQDGRVIRRINDPLLNFYFSDLCSRPSCYNCSFKTKDRVSDFTIFDSWHGECYSNDFKGGATAVLARTNNALAVMESISGKLFYKEVEPDRLIKDDGIMMLKSVNKNHARSMFFNDLLRGDSITELCIKYCDDTRKHRFKNLIKQIMVKTGCFDIYMKIKMMR